MNKPSGSPLKNHILLSFQTSMKILLHPLLFYLFFHSISATDFIFNGFNNSDLSHYGVSTVESRIVTLTNSTRFSIGRSLFPTKIQTKVQNSSKVLPFSTSFIFAMVPYVNNQPGHGIVFFFVPFSGNWGAAPGQHLGLFNRTNNDNPKNHVFGVEFDVFRNQEFNDINANHVGIDVNSLTSVNSETAGYWPDDGSSFKEFKLNNGENYQVWIDYADSRINVTMAPVGLKRPLTPLMNVSLNLSDVFEDEMYVGFTASTGQLIQSHKILAWSFSNTNFSISEALITNGLPSFLLPKSPFYKSKGFKITVGSFFFITICSVVALFFIRRRRRRIARERENLEEWESEYWPHPITYQTIENATNGFSEKNVIGFGGNGKVYKGVLEGGVEIAVKRISLENNEGREFLAEVSSLGRLKHRSLVGLRGWCRSEKGNMLVYDYMENGSLDKKLFDHNDLNNMLSCENRLRVLKDVAHGLLYLHEGWESRVLHRDIKSSNVLLDKDMNGRLGDFGLARIHGHGQVPTTTRVVGTVGYMAPEILHNGRVSVETDVFGFGVLILEVMCGRRPIEQGKVPLVEWVLQLMVQGQILNALDENLKAQGGFDAEEIEKVLHLGLLCAYPSSSARPTMRQVERVLDGKFENVESEIEDILKLKELSSKFLRHRPGSSHPKFEDIQQFLSLSSLNSFVQGR